MKFKSLVIALLAFCLMGSANSCDAVVQDGAQNPGKYLDAGGNLVDIVKNTDVDNETGLETAANVTNSAAAAVGAVSFIPGVSAIAGPLEAGLLALGAGLTWLAVRQRKKIRVETARADKSEKIANNYGEGLDAARMEGDNKGTLEIEHLEKYYDKETKAHYNATGATVLE